MSVALLEPKSPTVDDLVLFRHGESQSNWILDQLRRGVELPRELLEQWVETPDHDIVLTNEGTLQSRPIGVWMTSHLFGGVHGLDNGFDRYLTSPYARTIQTAYEANIPGAKWDMEARIRERNRGLSGPMTLQQHQAANPANARRRERDPFHWSPEEGEPLAEVADIRVRSFLGALGRMAVEDGVRSVGGSTHGEWLRALFTVLHRWTPRQYQEAMKDPYFRIGNGNIVHLSNRNPETGQRELGLPFMRIVRPYQNPDDQGEWRRVVPGKYSNEELAGLTSHITGLELPGNP